MDISALHTATENLAEWLSEVTQGDLGQPTPLPDRDVGDLYVHLIERNTGITTVLTAETRPVRSRAHPMRRSALDVSANLYGGGFEELYRQTAQQTEGAFASIPSPALRYCIDGAELDASALYEKHVSETVIHTWDLAQAMGFDYLPASDVTHQVLTTLQKSPPESVDAVWEYALRMSGRVPLPDYQCPRCSPSTSVGVRRTTLAGDPAATT
ncbi:maleylpyruvate isomerase family mycothiol-dependent enzyme [Rhodococcus erythropolis]|uniref:maleylpyruvate isomerase family mycothiol-dependent enzyme n=1 Tax=Rhodococcus erythropolis TaxID=1833 RepID=UPI0009957414|nr:maleylpyruvate isomerase family mycothiol-dependent enzyme [Rhodococcus erythropolis]